MESALFEHRFWLQVLGDHARFILNALPVKEQAEAARAAGFIEAFDRLLEAARGSAPDIARLNRAAYEKAGEIRAFKLHLLRRHLTEQFDFNLPPTFVNHMVNEVEEYLRVLGALVAGELPPLYHETHHHIVWLVDAVGHAASIAGSLDFTEKRLIEMSQTFEKHFQDFYFKAVELAGYLRAQIGKFPALSRFNKEVELEMVLFMQFLGELEEMDLKLELLGTLSPLMADHMYREECYYLTKLSLVSEIKAPACDPGKPRVE
nr:DUF2935 domain-containing protein [Paenibacillus hamazuiensis]